MRQAQNVWRTRRLLMLFTVLNGCVLVIAVMNIAQGLVDRHYSTIPEYAAFIVFQSLYVWHMWILEDRQRLAKFLLRAMLVAFALVIVATLPFFW